ncbi:MAG: ATP synthase F1 subunit gamma [Patescibacteria group bacterium]
MANIRQIKRRIKTAKNISQITKALELVSAAKMRKAQAAALSGKLYAQKIYEMVMRLASKATLTNHPLLSLPKPTGKRLLIILSTNKGLCGGLNTVLFRFILTQYKSLTNIDVVTVGVKGSDFVSRLGHTVIADFSQITPREQIVPALIQLVTEKFVSGLYDGVDVVSNEFISIARQVPKKKTILPLTLQGVDTSSVHMDTKEFLIEPSVTEVFDALLPHYLENQVRDAMLQAEASEHSARMLAMHNATENAKSLSQELTLVYNRARQEKITYEITDMVTARLAVEHI